MANKNRTSQKRKLPIFPVAVVVILVALVAFAWIYGKKETPKKIDVPSTPVSVSSVEQSLAPYRGQVIILDIWATWCGPCIKEIPDFVKLREKYASQGFEIIG